MTRSKITTVSKLHKLWEVEYSIEDAIIELIAIDNNSDIEDIYSDSFINAIKELTRVADYNDRVAAIEYKGEQMSDESRGN